MSRSLARGASLRPGALQAPRPTRQGTLSADAYLAAIALEQDLELISLDRDLARFPELRWRRSG